MAFKKLLNWLITSETTRCFYSTTKHLSGPHRGGRFSRVFYFDCLVFLYFNRYFILSYSMYNNFSNGLHLIDPMAAYFYKRTHTYDSFTPVGFCLFGFFIFICRLKMYQLNEKTPTWTFWRQLVVDEEDRYYRLQFKGKKLAKVQKQIEAQWRLGMFANVPLPESVLAFFCKVLARIEIFLKLEDVPKDVLFAKPISFLPNLSPSFRCRILRNNLIADAFAYVLIVIFTFLAVSLIISEIVLKMAPPFLSSPGSLLVLSIDTLFVGYSFKCLIRCSFYFVICTTIATLTLPAHCVEETRALAVLLAKFRPGPGVVLPLALASKLRHFQLEHNRATYLAVAGSVELFGDIMFTFLATNIPVNVYLIRLYAYKDLQPMPTYLVLSLLGVQAAAATIVFSLLAYSCAAFHSAKKLIPKLMALLPGRVWLLYRLKYDDLFARLNSGIKLAITVGPLGGVTYSSALEYLFLYIGYLLMVFQ